MNAISKIRNYIENKHVLGNKSNYDWLLESKRQLESCLFAKAELVIIEDPDEGGYAAYYPDLPGCITCGETIEEVKANAIDAKSAWFDAVLEDLYKEMNAPSSSQEKGHISLSEIIGDWEAPEDYELCHLGNPEGREVW